MNEYNYCIQCTDTISGVTGCFFYDERVFNETRKFSAISPVQKSTLDFYKWTVANGFVHKNSYGLDCVMVKACAN